MRRSRKAQSITASAESGRDQARIVVGCGRMSYRKDPRVEQIIANDRAGGRPKLKRET
ncbi:hypothetical protein AB0E01_17375 [Nocardia vinacea]|uniref:hypothetical protein n=1 Tax=Nocardia vinacea TaxID=96468 RepID=UPI0033CC9313